MHLISASKSFVIRSTSLHTKAPMKTTIDIPEKELKDAMKFTKANTKRDAVVQALEDFNRRQRMADLIKYTGTFKSMATMEEIDALDLARTKQIFGE